MLVDSHVHLDHYSDDEVAAMLRRARRAGVTRVLTIGVDVDTSRRAVELAERFQARLADRGIPPYRLEVSSALRTAEAQARLRETNENAASGVSAEEVAKQVAAQAVTGRFTEAEEVADLVVLLAGARAGNVTGADFVIDGGMIATL